MIVAFDHASLLTDDLDAALAFYGERLGCRVAARRTVAEAGMEIADLVAPGGAMIEIIRPLAGGKPSGVKHLAFRSDDIDAEFARFRAAGVPLLHAEVQAGPGCRFFFAKSPAGEWIEVIQPD